MEGFDVKISIKTSQHTDDGSEDMIESFYKGKRMEKNGSIYINFLEFETKKDSRNTIKISDDEVLFLRKGEVISNLRFNESKKHRSDYVTPYGVFDMSLDTRRISKKIDDNEIKINLDYKIAIKGLFNAQNRVHIKITNI